MHSLQAGKRRVKRAGVASDNIVEIEQQLPKLEAANGRVRTKCNAVILPFPAQTIQARATILSPRATIWDRLHQLLRYLETCQLDKDKRRQETALRRAKRKVSPPSRPGNDARRPML